MATFDFGRTDEIRRSMMRQTPLANAENLKTAKDTTWTWIETAIRSRYPRIVRIGQIFLDFVTVLAANSAAYSLYLFLDLGKQHVDPSLYWSLNIFASLGVIIVLSHLGLYNDSVGVANIEETSKLVKGIFYAAIAVFVVSFFIREHQYSRMTAVLAVPFNLFFLYVQRIGVTKIQEKVHLKGIGVRRCLIYGAGDAGLSIARRLFSNRQLGWIPVGFLDDDPSKKDLTQRASSGPNGVQLRVLGSWNDFEVVCRVHHIDDLIVAIPSDPSHRALERAVAGCNRLGIRYHFVPSTGSQLLPSLQFENLDGVPLFSPRTKGNLALYEVAKRFFDIVGSALLLVILSPLLGLIALLIRADSRGPAIFRQKRVGIRGCEFVIYKFRTMYVTTAQYAPTPAARNEPRITRLGRFLRHSSFDELPQLINVLRGEMSFVGPRPEMPFIVAAYDDHQRQRLNVKPGITGLWQISGDRAFQIHENLEYDLYYIANRSLFLDFAILFQTFFSALRGIGAW